MIGRIGYDEFAREDVMKPESIVVVKRQRKWTMPLRNV